MGAAGNSAKARWNAKHYTQVKVSVSPEVASAFRAACEAAGISMASKLAQLMADYSECTAGSQQPAPDALSTRGKRRKTIKAIARQMEQIRDAEARYRDNIPENLHGSSAYEAADESVAAMDEAIDLLEAIY